MLNKSRALCVVALLALAVGPVSMAPAAAQNAPATQIAQTTAGQVSGTVTDAAGAPLAGATVTLRGPQTYTATSDAEGKYAIANVAPGVYTAVAARGGYQGATENQLVVTGGSATTLDVELQPATFSSLQTIGRTSTRVGRGPRSSFNTTTASQQIIGQDVVREQSATQVRNLLNQTPGVISGLPPSVNPASPGAITFPNVRGSLGFETATLLDGHPLSNGKFGDYVTTFWNPAVFQAIEVVKGPGAAVPQISHAIGGTVNLRTLDPTTKPTGNVTFGFDSFGGTFSNVTYSATTLNQKLGFVVVYAVNGTPGPAGTSPLLYSLPATGNGWAYYDSRGSAVTLPANPYTSAANPLQANPNAKGITKDIVFGALTPTIFTNKTELGKIRYRFSGATSFTASVLASQTWSDQNGNNGDYLPTSFQPGIATYAGGFPTGPTRVLQSPFAYGDEWEINNEPIYQAELRTAYHNDNVLARYYHASLNRLQYNGATNPAAASPLFPVRLYGVDASGNALNGLDPFGQPYQAQQAGPNYYFSSAEEDRIYGYSFQWDHPFGAGNVLSFATDQNYSGTHAYNQFQPETFASVPQGSTQNTASYMLRAQIGLTPKLNATAAYYLNRFASHFGSATFPTAVGGSPTLNFLDQVIWHNDARLGLQYRLDPNTSLRLALGSAISPPYLATLATPTRPAALCGVAGGPACPTGINGVYVNSASGAGVRPETAFGVDVGGDLRWYRDPLTTVTLDYYRTNLFNQFINTTFPNGTATVGGVTLPLWTRAFGNLGASRYEGIELGVTRSPSVGWGYVAQGALLRGYAYNVPAGGYPGAPGIVSFVNFSDQSVSNQAIPYSQGYVEANYHSAKGAVFALGGTYYGANNGFAIPATFFVNATARFPVLSRGTYVQLAADNLLNSYPFPFPVLFSGIGVPEANGTWFATTLKNYGPRNLKISISHDIGSR